MHRRLMTCAALALAACSPRAAAPPAADKPATPAAAISTAPAGAYTLDPSHASIIFKVEHLGFSRYTAGFDRADASLAFDPANPAAMHVEASIDVASLDLNAPPAGFLDEMLGGMFFDAKAFPAITFKSTKVEVTGPRTAKLTGDLTLHGVTRPVVLDTAFNGGWAANAMDGARIGFSAHTVIQRSAFGMGYGVPAPGTKLGVSDDVEISIETEFSSGKKLAAAS